MVGDSNRAAAAELSPESGDESICDARNTFSGDFIDVFRNWPVEPAGKHIEWEVINIFR